MSATLFDKLCKDRSDKGSHPYLKRVPKNYHLQYGRWFGNLRNEIKTVLEIGGGRSAALWTEYFPNATIVEFDIARFGYPYNNVVGWVGDMRSKEEWSRVLDQFGGFDIVIDDGSHVPDDSRIAFESLWPYVHPGGYYAIEDLHADPLGYAALLTELPEPVTRNDGLVIWHKVYSTTTTS